MQNIPEAVIGLDEMHSKFGFGEFLFEAHEESPTAIGFRAPFWWESEAQRMLVLSWRNRVPMSSPGYAQSPMQMIPDTMGALNDHFGKAFRNVKFSLLTGVCVLRSDIKTVNEFIVTSADAALHVLLLAVWPKGHAPKVHGLNSSFGRRYGAIDFARATTKVTKSDYGHDYWLLPIESLGPELHQYLLAHEQLAQQMQALTWQQYALDCPHYRNNMLKLIPQLEKCGLSLDCDDQYCASIRDKDNTRCRTVWYDNAWLCELDKCISSAGSNIDDLFRPFDLIEPALA